MAVTLPPNVHISKHPCLLAKLSQLRSGTTSAKEVKGLIHEISLIVGCEALANAVVAVPGPTVRPPPPPLSQTTPNHHPSGQNPPRLPLRNHPNQPRNHLPRPHPPLRPRHGGMYALPPLSPLSPLPLTW